MPRYTFMRPCMHYPCSFQAVVGDRGARRRAILTARATHDQYPTTKRTPLFFWRRPEADYTTAQSDGSSTDTRCAIILFCLMAHDGRESPLSRSHTTHRGGFQRTDGSGPFHLGTPPCHLGVSSRGGPKSVPPVSTIITRTCKRRTYTEPRLLD